VTHEKQDYYGALVGWTSQRLGPRFVLQVQSVTSPPPHQESEVDSFYFVVDKNQAVQLGNCLFNLAGATRPARPRGGLFRRLLACL
jgi:biofilm regulator BssS